MTITTKYSLKSCVWELTLACNARCVHCGSSAGSARTSELTTGEALALIEELARLGCESVTLSGGEPLLRKDWLVLGRAIVDAGMHLEMITNGLDIERQASAVVDAGFFAVTFSVDGDYETHDALRGVRGGLWRLQKGAQILKDSGVRIGAVTQVNRRNLHLLESIYEWLRDNHFDGWQVQLTIPHGEAAADDGAICLLPIELRTLDETLLKLKARSDFFVQGADNLGYMGRNEPTLRSGIRCEEKIYGGCQAGLSVVGIVSDGTVRGCLSLPPSFDEGNIRQQAFTEIWNDENAFAYNRKFTIDDLSGPCAHCPFQRICRGGCTSQAYATTGTTSHNPYCLRRLEEGWE